MNHQKMSDLPSVAGRMEMTHAGFQHACQVMLRDILEDPNYDTRLVYLLCEAVRASRECCELAACNITVPTFTCGQVKSLREALNKAIELLEAWGPAPGDALYIREFRKALAATAPKEAAAT